VERSIEMLVALQMFILGLSHIVQHRAWADFFILLREKGAAGNFFNAFLHTGVGTLVVSFHNVWSGIPVVLTVLGWAWVLKGFLYFVVPSIGLRSLRLVSIENSRRFAVAGVFMIFVSGLLAYDLVTA
jgi:hypothetical protein